MPRFHCSVPLSAGVALTLPPGAARHVQVLRLQPGGEITLFDGAGGEYAATVERMGRSEVTVQVGAHDPVEREAPRAVQLAVGMPTNERMDWLVEKATELGAAVIQPLVTAHGVLRLSGERADKKVAHWQAVAIASCEQCGRNRIPQVLPVRSLNDWLGALPNADAGEARSVLSFAPGARAASTLVAAGPQQRFTVLSGPEGGLSATEEEAALRSGFAPLTLGPRVLRAETAALAALVTLAG
ncbi:16S rRNA (uracil(1498)-N(3))-methyltransferase [Variovorax fucosicus]|uniref:16S rRNA (uracil(1498)-N(3))-methyltransferase n=1 Tax=Variovorax fucosicus TaxID=3053517 RepID=UPI002575A153|nr:16S rRNA (uracil(1498)-N(3))-methyltransferase [Variovorax sp. J22G47]MDM0055063.1 16S rRNA (uracil(1498)-N(3))-methyltransferase [Variovorax sp. J22G47]